MRLSLCYGDNFQPEVSGQMLITLGPPIGLHVHNTQLLSIKLLVSIALVYPHTTKSYHLSTLNISHIRFV